MSAGFRNPELEVLFVRPRLDRWRGRQADVPNRSDAIRCILDVRLTAGGVTRVRRRSLHGRDLRR
jgi:hypothetical protein